MKLSKNSKKIISFLLNTKKDKKHKSHHFTTKTESIMEILYDDIFQSFHYVNGMKQTKKPEIYVKKLTTVYGIPKPKNFNSNSFPPEIRKYIDESSGSQITFDFSLQERGIRIHFIVEETNPE